MDSVKLDRDFSITIDEAPAASTATPSNGRSEMASTEKKKSKMWKTKSSYLPKIGCLRIQEDEEGNFDAEVDIEGELSNPSHLVVMVNGIMGSDDNWKFVAGQFLKHYPRDVVVHCSKVNSSKLTLDGVDVMGDRLAKEVISVRERHSSVKKISFVAHSLGGLVSRYAIAKLYRQHHAKDLSQANEDCKNDRCEATDMQEKFKSRIAGLEPVNFITLATPHLGSRWHRQVPMFCGLYPLEKVGARISWWLFGRSGKHLFLADRENGKPPLLFQMVSDYEDLKFMSALQSFKRHVAYANIRFDHLVGWSTSSLRHPKELPQRRYFSRDEKYRHIVHLDRSKIPIPRKKLLNDVEVNGYKSVDMEEQMFQALTKLSWERVDVKFNGCKQRFMAHNTIVVVKSCCPFSDGADVIQHLIDNFHH